MNTRLCLTLATALFFGISLADDKAPASASHVDVEAAEKLIKDGKVSILDVRTAEEYKAGHLAGATNIDFTESDFEKKAAELDKSKSYLVHCASGRRSSASLEVLQKLGFKQIYHLDGGIKAWEAAGKRVEK